MADDSIKSKFELDITQFKTSISDMNRGIRIAQNNFKAAAGSLGDWKKSQDGIEAKMKSLTDVMSLQRAKVEALSKEYDSLKSSGTASESSLKKLQEQISRAAAELGKTEGEFKDATDAQQKFAKETDDTSAELKDYADKTEDAGKKTNKFVDLLKNAGSVMKSGVFAGAKAIGASMATIVASAIAGAIKLGKEVVQSFGELEQNLGGSEAVFGKYAANIQKIGEDAYKTLGVSQSAYLSTANKIGALFQGSGIDQQTSVKLTEKAMQRAADAASVMGVDMQMAMEAVTGAAKGNYTMMDNLGVKMDDTSVKAYAMANGFKGTWAEASNADKAQYAMQMFFEKTEQYAGNFEKESTKTIAGSLGMLQASTQSFIAGLGNADADMSNLTANMVAAFEAVVTNIVPVIDNIVAALPNVMDALLKAIEKLIPKLLPVVTKLFNQILNTIVKLLPTLIPLAVSAIMSIVDALIENMPLMIDAVYQLFDGIMIAIADNLQPLIDTALLMVTSLVDIVLTYLPYIIDLGLQIIVALAQGIAQSLPTLIPTIVQTVMSIVDVIMNNLGALIEAAIAIILAIVKGLIAALPQLIAWVPKIVNSIIDAIVDNLDLLISAAIDIMMALVDGLLNNLPMIIDATIKVMGALANGLIKAIPMLLSTVPEMFGKLAMSFKSMNWGKLGGDIIKGIADGVSNAAGSLVNSVGDAAEEAFNSVKNFFGIASPSKLMRDKIGKFIPEGIAVGILENTGSVDSAMKNLTSGMTASVDFEATKPVGRKIATESATATSGSGFALNITNFYNNTDKDLDSLAYQFEFARQKAAAALGG